MKRSGNNHSKLREVREREDHYGMDFDLDQEEDNRNQKYDQNQDEQDDWDEDDDEDDWDHEGGAVDKDSADHQEYLK